MRRSFAVVAATVLLSVPTFTVAAPLTPTAGQPGILNAATLPVNAISTAMSTPEKASNTVPAGFTTPATQVQTAVATPNSLMPSNSPSANGLTGRPAMSPASPPAAASALAIPTNRPQISLTAIPNGILRASGTTAGETATAVSQISATAVAQIPTTTATPSPTSSATSTAMSTPVQLPRFSQSADSVKGYVDGQRLILDVPFRSQLDGTDFQSSNCGPASLAMVLDAFGVLAPTFQVRNLINVQQKSFAIEAGTSLWDLGWIAGQAGLRTNGLNGGSGWHRWDWEEVRAEIQKGHPVITLVRMSKLPYRTNYRSDTDHYIVVMGIDGDKILVNDPALPGTTGALKELSREELEIAWDATSMPRHGAGFAATAEVHEFTFPPKSTPGTNDAALTLANGMEPMGTPIVVGGRAQPSPPMPDDSAQLYNDLTETTAVSIESLPPASVETVNVARIFVNTSSTEVESDRMPVSQVQVLELPTRKRLAAPWMLVAELFACGLICRWGLSGRSEVL